MSLKAGLHSETCQPNGPGVDMKSESKDSWRHLEGWRSSILLNIYCLGQTLNASGAGVGRVDLFRQHLSN